MENKLRKHTHTCMPKSHPPALAVHKDSQTISKSKPKIRIIHIFAPQIIKTDVENFRELVQRITGKPSGEKFCLKKPTIAADETKGIDLESRKSNSCSWDGLPNKRIKEEIALCSDGNSGGYLGGFSSDLEGFISEHGEFPLLPLDSTHMHGFEKECQLL